MNILMNELSTEYVWISHIRYFFIMGRDPVELGNERNINHPLCGCAVYVIQKNHRSIYNEVVQAEIINERKGDFNGK